MHIRVVVVVFGGFCHKETDHLGPSMRFVPLLTPVQCNVKRTMVQVKRVPGLRDVHMKADES